MVPHLACTLAHHQGCLLSSMIEIPARTYEGSVLDGARILPEYYGEAGALFSAVGT